MARARTKPEPRPYHHGDLRAALLAAAEKILEKDGIQALTLRAAARAVGVSHTAPQNHFGDLTGLLSELAAVGYQRMTAALTEARETGDDAPIERARRTGQAYVRFARAHPGLFVLMYRSERLDADRPSLRDAIEASREALRQTAPPAARAAPPLRQAAAGVARWSIVHGFSLLLIEGRLSAILRALPGDVTADDLLDAVLDVSRVDAMAREIARR